MSAASMSAAPSLAASRWALLAGNFAIGCGVMVVPGSLNDLAHSLDVSVAVGGQLIAIAAAVMCFGAPLAAGFVAGFDRRRLLTLTLLWFAAGHALSALAPDYASLLVLRVLTVVGAAVFTPQAAAAIGTMAPAEQRGRVITFVFLGWSLASVLGLPLHSYIGESFGWRWAFALVAVLSALGALWVWRALPDGVKPPALSLAAWKQVFTHPLLMAMVLVTALSATGQFTLFSYFAPYFRQLFGAGAGEVSFMFFWFGAFGLIGNVLLSRQIDRFGAARAVLAMLALIALSLAAWPLAGSFAAMALVLLPWGFGCFASNSAQQARLAIAAPALTSALVALNTSAMYLGQAVGAAGGGLMVAASGGYGALNWVGFGWLLAAIAVSVWVQRRMAGRATLAHVG
jgi:predicted MFS family arabinose efflux permease